MWETSNGRAAMDVKRPFSFTVRVEEDPATGDLVLPLPPESLDRLGWKAGDRLVWKGEGGGAASLRRDGRAAPGQPGADGVRHLAL